jgi:phenylalanyl-tRNA synthetase alpha chain
MSLINKVNAFKTEIDNLQVKTKEDVENFRLKFLSKKGLIPALFVDLKSATVEEKKSLGKVINDLKQLAEQKWNHFKEEMESSGEQDTESKIDLTLPGEPFDLGSRHPISIVRNQITEIFSRIGFVVSEGPEIEDDWHNFSALNFPEEHPARDMQDTFFIKTDDAEKPALRTHTSSVQVRVMENNKPPIRTISPGRVFRNEAISARAHCIFHQIEGLYVDEGVSFADLKQCLFYFAQEFFGKDTKIRFRPSYFPFTEPSAEMDIYWGLNSEADYRITKGTGWLEILGCGMVDPEVLKNCNIDPEKYAGFAFGMGIERIAMLKYQIKDLRMYFENDLRFLRQFANEVS